MISLASADIRIAWFVYQVLFHMYLALYQFVSYQELHTVKCRIEICGVCGQGTLAVRLVQLKSNLVL